MQSSSTYDESEGKGLPESESTFRRSFAWPLLCMMRRCRSAQFRFEIEFFKDIVQMKTCNVVTKTSSVY